LVIPRADSTAQDWRDVDIKKKKTNLWEPPDKEVLGLGLNPLFLGTSRNLPGT
jgi:hypothetical protein